jgi:ATP/maltotriose-dependent transcriptional regulator MalT
MLPVGLAGGDVAVFARSLARSLSHEAPTLPRLTEEAIRVSPTAARQARSVLHSILTEVEEPVESWLAIDDYHLLKPGSPVELLIEGIEASGRFRLLVASRSRPDWATARRHVYGDIHELTDSELALSELEADELLSGLDSDTKLIREEARGWPALVALAALANSAESHPETATLDALYDFFAEEIYNRASHTAQKSLLRIALLPSLNRPDFISMLGSLAALRMALDTGVVYDAVETVEMHPLARTFLLSKIAGQIDSSALVSDALDFALHHSYWDDAFSLIVRFDRSSRLDELIIRSYHSLVDAGRVSTLAEFGTYATARSGLDQSLLDLINAEIAYRDGLFERARSLGTAAAASLTDDHPLTARSLLLAGLSAQHGWQLGEAFELFSHALTVSTRPRDANDASWGRCMAAVFLEDPRLNDVIDEMGRLPHPTAEDRLRLGMGRQLRARLFDGLYELDRDTATAESLLPTITDPMVRSGWGNTHGYTLLLQARYDEAARVLATALIDIEQFGLEFGRPHVEWSLAAARLGLRQFARADKLLRKVEDHPGARRSTYLQLNTRALRARLLLSQRRVDDAIGLTEPTFRSAPRNAMYGEYAATRALALAVAGRTSRAVELAEEAGEITQAVETRVLVSAAKAVAFAGTDEAEPMAEALVSMAATLCTWDAAVCAFRASPTLLRLLNASSRRPEIAEVLGRSNDAALAHKTGISDRRPDGRHGLLSRREVEIVDLLRQGLRTREIAAALYIEASTVKVHVRHVLDKLDARTRAEAVARYAETIRSDGDAEGSSPNSSV